MQGVSLGKEAVLADSGQVGEIATRVGLVRREDVSTSSFTATGHVVNKRPIDVGTTEADRIEEGLGIRDKILLVGEFIGHHLGMAGIAEHHEPA